MKEKGIKKEVVSLGITICLMSYFVLSIILKLCGLDLFTITNDIKWGQDLSTIVNTNIYLLSLLQTLLFTINLFFVFSVTAKRYDCKKMVIITLLLSIPLYGLNVLFNIYKLPTFIISVVIPYFISLAIMKEKGIKNILWATLRYLLFSGFTVLVQIGLMFLKVNLLKCDYHSDNMFNVILLNFDMYIIYFSIYFLCKYKKFSFKRKNKKEEE